MLLLLYYVRSLFVHFSIEIVVSSQCLTEVEKMFGNLASTKENCVSNAHPRPNLQPPAPSVTVPNVQPVDSGATLSQQNAYGVHNSRTSLEAAPPVIYDHPDRDTPQSTHQSAHSIFFDQLCEGKIKHCILQYTDFTEF